MRIRCMRSKDNISPVRGAVILCAGKGERTGLSYNKVLHSIGVKTVLETVLDVFCETVDRITVVAAESDIARIEQITAQFPDVDIVIGGKTRFDSVRIGLENTPCDIAVIHDGARPFVTQDIIERSIDSAIKFGSGIAAVKSIDTVKRVGADGKAVSLPRDELYNVQTPQTFKYDEILSAYRNACTDINFTDDAEVYERAGFSPRLIDGDYSNIKITTAQDLLPRTTRDSRIGVGYDVHKLVEGRALILGGVNIPYEKGLLGHSDADVLTHAVMDALLSAVDLPDIGVLFPDTDERYLGISSMKLLSEVMNRLRSAGYTINNVSAVVIAERPKLCGIIPEIRKNLASALGINTSAVNVSATTAEGLGIVGNGAAIAASASCILTGVIK